MNDCDSILRKRAATISNYLLAQLMAVGHITAGLSGGAVPYWAGVVLLTLVVLVYDTVRGHAGGGLTPTPAFQSPASAPPAAPTECSPRPRRNSAALHYQPVVKVGIRGSI